MPFTIQFDVCTNNSESVQNQRYIFIVLRMLCPSESVGSLPLAKNALHSPTSSSASWLYGVPFVSKRFFSVNLRYSCHDSLSWRRFSFRGDDSLFAATILFSRRRLSFRGDDSLFAATILFSRRRFSFRGDDCLFVATILFSRRRFSFRGDDCLFAATIPFSRRRFSFRGDDSLFAATIVFSWRRFSFRGDDSLFVATMPFVSKRFFSVNLRYSCHDSLLDGPPD